MKKGVWITAAAVLLLAIGLTGCGKYVSSYRALALMRSTRAGSASVRFSELEGTMAFRLKCRKGSGALSIFCSAKLESGSATVYCDSDGTKREWFTIEAGSDAATVYFYSYPDGVRLEGVPLEAGEELRTPWDYVSPGTAYVVIETDGKCEEGSFRFEVEHVVY
ncbi:MAG: hypothetical protein K6C09_00050 [Oscillospiraceae bacterium]|nr:hypothetical protein [Oscillospiraceae bacterium]